MSTAEFDNKRIPACLRDLNLEGGIIPLRYPVSLINIPQDAEGNVRMVCFKYLPGAEVSQAIGNTLEDGAGQEATYVNGQITILRRRVERALKENPNDQLAQDILPRLEELQSSSANLGGTIKSLIKVCQGPEDTSTLINALGSEKQKRWIIDSAKSLKNRSLQHINRFLRRAA